MIIKIEKTRLLNVNLRFKILEKNIISFLHTFVRASSFYFEKEQHLTYFEFTRNFKIWAQVKIQKF